MHAFNPNLETLPQHR